MNQAGVLIVSDDTEFARTVAASWQAEKHAPEITLVTSDVWHPSGEEGYALVIVGPVHHLKPREIFSAVAFSPLVAIVYVSSDERESTQLRAEYPQLLVIPFHDGWPRNLIAVSSEAFRRIEAVARAQRAERLALELQRYATLGRYMLEVRPSVNNALTSVLGNADLLLLEPARISGDSREQMQAIHAMALRLNEIMQRFSSLASEVRANENESQAETIAAIPGGFGRR